MANKNGRCVLCGDGPTVKVHLFPRALMLDLRGDGKHLVEGSRRQRGTRFRQNGIWDDRILCKQHEDICGAGDEYAVEFCRRLEGDAQPSQNGKAYQIRNSKPDLMMRFVHASVWRQVISTEGRRLGLNLGPYKAKLEAYLFGDGAPLQALVGRSNLRLGQTMARIAIAPYKQKLGPWRVWHFTVGGLDVYLKTDQKPFPREWTPYLANENDPLILPTIDPLDVRSIPMLRPVFQQMMKPQISRFR